MNKLTFEEWKIDNSITNNLKDNQFSSIDDLKNDFKKFNNLDMDDILEEIDREEYELYLQR